ncbi:MAG: hypothetical protein HQ567_11535 [Candidatus Nealsonbacteria bacterium]|nr:hypothetical protein [Candidatus Nealsonbacteria bacterium]
MNGYSVGKKGLIMKKIVMLTVLVVIAMCIPSAVAAERSAKPEAAPLTQVGEKLLASYTDQLTVVKADIAKSLPKINEQKKSAYQKALDAEKAAENELKAAQQSMGDIAKGQALVAHAKGEWIGGADKGIAETQAKLKKAKTQAERDALQKNLARWQKNRQDGVDALKERQAFLDKALSQKPKLPKLIEAANEKLANAKENAMKSANELGIGAFLASDKLDGKLAKYQVLAEATPRELAEFAQQGRTQEGLITTLLSDDDLMIQIAIASGVRGGKYGPAMKIYNDIQKASSKANSGELQRLALAVSLEHAIPKVQDKAKANIGAPATVNPVNRYLYFEKAYLNNELDPAFNMLSVWDYRMVVGGGAPDESYTWGRKMLANYRPDQILRADYKWRYVESVRSELSSGGQNNKYDQDDLSVAQNILKNGGSCGRKAVFGGFILRSFGIPTTNRPQRGHATLVHWTPDGWVLNLGTDRDYWGKGWVPNAPGSTLRGKADSNKDTVFLALTQARMTGEPYKQVWRAKTVGAVQASGIWDSVSLYRQRAIIQEAKAKTLAAVGKEKVDIVKAKITEADEKISVGADGTITIPAAACSKPTKSTFWLKFMPSNLGGKQLHCSYRGNFQTFEYTFNAPKAGKYALTARVVTPSWKQHLTVKANGGNPVDIALPYTVGMWDKTQPVEITMTMGKNVLTFSRKGKGLTIRDFTLKPVN